MYNTLVDKNRHGILVYGTSGGFTELGVYNLQNINYSEDLPFITSTFNLSKNQEVYSIISKNDISIFSVYSGGLHRNGFYSISLFFDGKPPKAKVVIQKLKNLVCEFEEKIITTIDSKDLIPIEKKGQINNLINGILISKEDFKSEKSIKLQGNIICEFDAPLLENRNFDLILDFLDEFSYDSIFFDSNGQTLSKVLSFNRDKGIIKTSSQILNESKLLNILHTERMTKRFSFSSISDKNTSIPGTLILKFGNNSLEKRIENTALPIEFVVEDNTEGILKFIPDDKIKYEVYEDVASFIQLKGFGESSLNISIKENSSKIFYIKSDVSIYGLKVVSNGAEIIPEYEQYKIYDQSGTIQITSTSHLPQNVDIKDIYINSTITLLSNTIELEIYDGNNIISFSKDIELKANGNRLSTNYVNRADLPLEIKVNSKKFFKNEPINIPKGFIDSKYPIYLKNISENYIGIGSKKGGKNSGIIGPDKQEPWYSKVWVKALIGTLAIVVLLIGAYLYLYNDIKITPNCENIVKGTPQFDEYCKIDTTCVNCKSIVKDNTDTTKTKPITPISQDDTIENNKDSNLSIGSSSEKPKPEIKDIEKISCKNFKDKPLEEQKSFCADVENKNCEYCKPSCKNYNHLPKVTQKAYCNNPDTNCKKCPPSESQNASLIQNGGTKSESETTQIDCSHLEDISGTQLENLCKNNKNKSCAQCKNINKK